MLSLSTSNKITFNVNVSGTAAIPSVRCLIGEHPALSFPATKLSNDEWEVIIDLPAGTKPGAHSFKVEVLLNGRLFTPINYSIDISADDVNPAPAPAVDAKAEDVGTTPLRVSNLMSMVSKITEPEPTPPVPVSERVEKPVEKPVEPKKTKPIEIPPAKKAVLRSLQRPPVPKLPVVKVPQAKISMLDIANEVNEKAPPVPKKPKPVQEARVQSIPVSITKGAVIYR